MTKKGIKAPEGCEGCSNWKRIRRKVRISEFLEKAIAVIEDKLTAKELKPTMGDYLKLLQLEQEMAHESPKEIQVTWVEPPTPSEDSK